MSRLEAAIARNTEARFPLPHTCGVFQGGGGRAFAFTGVWMAQIMVGELRRADSYQPLDEHGDYAPEQWPVLKTTGEMASFKNAHNRPVGPLYYKQPGYGDETNLMLWTPGEFRLLGREYPDGSVEWIYRTAGSRRSSTIGGGEG